MSNSFPSIISNEPPELYSDEDDDDSEEFRNFSSGLKVDIDPSPVSSPRKSKLGQVSTTTPSPLSLPSSVPNGIQIPPNSSSSNDTVLQDNNNISTSDQVLEQTNKITESCDDDLPLSTTQCFSNNINNNNKSIAVNNGMKTSYIGTIESLEDDDEDDENGIESESKIIQTELGSEKTNNSIDQTNFVAFENNSQQSVPVIIQQNSNNGKEHTEESSANVSEDQYTPPESNFHSLTENKEDGDANVDDEFEDFQEFQTTSIQKVEDGNEREVIKDEDENNTIYIDSNCEFEKTSPEKVDDNVTSNINIPESSLISSTIIPDEGDEEIKFEDASGGSSNNECANEINNDKDFCDCSTEIESKQDDTPESSLNEIISAKSEVKNEASSISVPSDQITAQIDSDNTIEFQADFSAFPDPSELEDKEGNKVDTFDDNSKEFNVNIEDDDFDDFDNFQDFQTSSAIITTTTKTSQSTEDSTRQICSSGNSLDTSHTVIDSSDKLELCNSTDNSQPSTSDLQSNQRQQEQSSSLSNLDSITDKNKIEENDDDFDDFDDFQAFQSTPSTSQSVPMPSVISTNNDPQSSSTEMSTSSVMSSSSTTTAATSSSSSTITSSALTTMDGDSTSQFNVTSSSLLENKFETLVKSLFPSTPIPTDEIPESVSNFKTIDKELKEDSDNQQWSRVEDFEGSQGLLFKWLNSCAYQKLLKSLKIDSSTIMYSGKWGPIPRFASSCLDSPLLPESGSKTGDNLSQINTNEPTSHNSKETTSPSENETGVGKAAGEGTSSKGTSGCQISQEAEQIIAQLPDLSYMRSKTLVFPHNILQVQTLARDV